MRTGWSQTGVAWVTAVLLGLQIGSFLHPPLPRGSILGPKDSHGPPPHRGLDPAGNGGSAPQPANPAPQPPGEPVRQRAPPSVPASPQKQKKALIVTAASWGYRAMLEQWLCRATRLGLHRRHEIAVFAMDDAYTAIVIGLARLSSLAFHRHRTVD